MKANEFEKQQTLRGRIKSPRIRIVGLAVLLLIGIALIYAAWPSATGTSSVPTHVPDATIPNNAQGMLSKPVILNAPYQDQTGGSSDKLSLQYAVMAILGQVGLKYDFDASIQNANQECRTHVTPDFQNKPCRAALEELLAPFRLTYEVEGDTVTLKRK